MKVLKDEIKKPYFLQLKEFLWSEGVHGPDDDYTRLKIYPSRASTCTRQNIVQLMTMTAQLTTSTHGPTLRLWAKSKSSSSVRIRTMAPVKHMVRLCPSSLAQDAGSFHEPAIYTSRRLVRGAPTLPSATGTAEPKHCLCICTRVYGLVPDLSLARHLDLKWH